jgi:UDP-N-acetylglucosamine acyltransferase
VKNRYAVLGINSIGMRRAGIAAADIMVVRQAFRILYRSDLMLRPAIDRVTAELGEHPLVAEMLQFIRESKRGVMRSTREPEREGD